MTEKLREIIKKAGAREVYDVRDLGKRTLGEALSKPKKAVKKQNGSAAVPKKRSQSGESVLIELMTSGKWWTKEELRHETGLAESSINMYCNGYLERVRKKPYRVVKDAAEGVERFRLEAINADK